MISFDGPPAGDAAPGLLDIHAHGALGHEYGLDAEGTRLAVAHHRSKGTRKVVASLVSASPHDLAARVATLAPLVADGTLAGIHLEGPFIAPARCGAHDSNVLRDPDLAELVQLLQLCADADAAHAIRHLTFAPERRGTVALIAMCATHGIRPAIGHTDADAATVTRTIGLISELTGAPALITHLFNGMPPFHHRSGGPVAASLAAAARGEAIVELIGDGVHVAPEVVRMVFETVGPEQIALVSDAMSATGLGDGEHRIGALPVTVVDGVARLRGSDDAPGGAAGAGCPGEATSADEGGMPGGQARAGQGALAGSTATLADVLRWTIEVAGVEAASARTSATLTPARALGL